MFRRSMTVRLSLAVLTLSTVCAALVVWAHDLVAPALPLVTGLLVVSVMWSWSASRRTARREELVRSFAGLTVVHHGHAVHVDEDPWLGEYATRSTAARAAIDHGSWAVLVRAWGRYHVLSGSATTRVHTPVPFRSRAVADVVPSIVGDALSA